VIAFLLELSLSRFLTVSGAEPWKRLRPVLPNSPPTQKKYLAPNIQTYKPRPPELGDPTLGFQLIDTHAGGRFNLARRRSTAQRATSDPVAAMFGRHPIAATTPLPRVAHGAAMRA
jgi:hypothetical protein